MLDRRDPRAALRIGNFEGDGPWPALSKVVDRRVPRDPEKPCRELVLGVVAGQRVKHFQEDLLREVERVVAVTDHPGDVCGDPGLVPPDEDLEELLLSREDPPDEKRVVGWFGRV